MGSFHIQQRVEGMDEAIIVECQGLVSLLVPLLLPLLVHIIAGIFINISIIDECHVADFITLHHPFLWMLKRAWFSAGDDVPAVIDGALRSKPPSDKSLLRLMVVSHNKLAVCKFMV